MCLLKEFGKPMMSADEGIHISVLHCKICIATSA